MVDLSASDPYLDLLSAEGPAPLLHRLRLEDPVHYYFPVEIAEASR